MLGFLAALLGFAATSFSFLLGFRLGVRKEQQARMRRLNALRKIINGKV